MGSRRGGGGRDSRPEQSPGHWLPGACVPPFLHGESEGGSVKGPVQLLRTCSNTSKQAGLVWEGGVSWAPRGVGGGRWARVSLDDYDPQLVLPHPGIRLFDLALLSALSRGNKGKQRDVSEFFPHPSPEEPSSALAHFSDYRPTWPQPQGWGLQRWWQDGDRKGRSQCGSSQMGQQCLWLEGQALGPHPHGSPFV